MAISMYQPTPLPQSVADPNAATNAQILQNVQAQINAQRAAQMADQLQAAQAAPIQGNGAPISAFQGLTKALQAYEAKKQRTKADTLAIQAIAGQQQQESQRFNSLFPGTASPVDPTGSASPSSPVSALATGLGAPTAAPPPSPQVAALTNPAANPAPGPSPDVPSPAMAPPSASPAGASVTGAGTPPPPAASAAPPAAPPITQVAHAAVSSMPSLTGDPNQDRLMAMQMGVPKYFEAVAKRYDWTDQQKNDAAVGITASMRRTMDVAKSLQGAVVPGSSSTLSLDANGNPVAQQVAGLQSNIAGTTAATTAATQSQTPHEVKDSQGRSTFVYTTPPAAAGGRMGVPTASDAGGGQTTAGAAFQGDQGKAAVALGTQINADAENALQGKRTLSEMGNLLQGFTPGAGAPVLQAFGSVAQAMGVPEQKVQAFTGMNVGDTEAFQKGTANLAAEAAKQMTNKVTQQEFKVYLANNPNWMMTPSGIKKAMDFMGKGFDQTLDKQQQWQAFTQNPKNDPGRYAIDFPAAYNSATRQKIGAGGLNSSPTAAIPISTGTDKAAGPQSKLPVISAKADYDKLPSGATFQDSSGRQYTKP